MAVTVFYNRNKLRTILQKRILLSLSYELKKFLCSRYKNILKLC